MPFILVRLTSSVRVGSTSTIKVLAVDGPRIMKRYTIQVFIGFKNITQGFRDTIIKGKAL